MKRVNIFFRLRQYMMSILEGLSLRNIESHQEMILSMLKEMLEIVDNR